MKTYGDIEEAVKKANGQFITCEMSVLRDVHGAGKLGVHVVKNISEELTSRGLGHYPTDLPSDQWAKVRIFRQGGPLGSVVRALASFGAKEDELLRSLSGKSSDALERIREIVCE